MKTKMTRTSSLDIGHFVKSKNGWYKNPRKTFKIQTVEMILIFSLNCLFAIIAQNESNLVKNIIPSKVLFYFQIIILISRLIWKTITCFGDEWIPRKSSEIGFQNDISSVYSNTPIGCSPSPPYSLYHIGFII